MTREVKKKNFYVNLYILIPGIFAGISAISVIASYQLGRYYEKSNQPSTFNVFLLIIILGLASFILSFVILHVILKPVRRFINQAQKIPIFVNSQSEETEKATDDISKLTHVFDQVTNILNHVEAKELFPDIIGSSSIMRNIFTQIIKIAPTDSTVLISGESGTGKELIASGIYQHSLRKGKQFVKINCVAIPEGLLESELFGHERGSFTGAIAQKKGKFEIANGGTIFLDEIGDMPLTTQAKLLRVLQEREFERVGGINTIKVDVRFIAATNKNLQKMIKEGTFREDLYFRINVFSISVPPLRERREDISQLANFFLRNLDVPEKLSVAALQMLIGYAWPGNIRELKNVLEQAIVFSERNTIEPKHLPENIIKQSPESLVNNLNNEVSLDERLIILEKEMIINALRKTGYVQVKAATALGINQRSLWHRIRKHNIDVSSLKNLQ